MTNEDKQTYLLRFHRFQKSREKFFAPKIFAAIRSQYDTLLTHLQSGHTEQDAVHRISSAPIVAVLKQLYLDAGIQYGAKIRADLKRSTSKKAFHRSIIAEIQHKSGNKARLPMGFSEQMRQLIQDYFSVDILNQSEGITQTTRELIQQVFTDAYQKGEGINDIIEQLKDTELSRVRSRLIARTETVTASNGAAHFVAKDTGLELNKQWMSAHDKRVRNSHRFIDGHTVGIDDYFKLIDGATMLVPGARKQENGLPVPAEDTINCRCTTLYLPID